VRPEVEGGGVRDDAVVPERDRVRLPVEADLEVRVVRDLVEEEVEDRVRLRLRDPDDAACEACSTLDSGSREEDEIAYRG
jgi:hypothetical protein